MNWLSPSPARNLNLVIGYVVGDDLVIKEACLCYEASLTQPGNQGPTCCIGSLSCQDPWFVACTKLLNEILVRMHEI